MYTVIATIVCNSLYISQPMTLSTMNDHNNNNIDDGEKDEHDTRSSSSSSHVGSEFDHSSSTKVAPNTLPIMDHGDNYIDDGEIDGDNIDNNDMEVQTDDKQVTNVPKVI